jgi:hypothetical protein
MESVRVLSDSVVQPIGNQEDAKQKWILKKCERLAREIRERSRHSDQEFENIQFSSNMTTSFEIAWNTTGFAYGKYIIKAYVDPVSYESNTTNNMLTGSSVIVTFLGDVNGDGTVNVLDLILIANHLGHTDGDGHIPYSLDWYRCINSDLNDDRSHNVLDLILCANHLGQHW